MLALISNYWDCCVICFRLWWNTMWKVNCMYIVHCIINNMKMLLVWWKFVRVVSCKWLPFWVELTVSSPVCTCLTVCLFWEGRAILSVFCVLHAARSYGRRRGKAHERVLLSSCKEPWNYTIVVLLLRLSVCLFSVTSPSSWNTLLEFKPLFV